MQDSSLSLSIGLVELEREVQRSESIASRWISEKRTSLGARKCFISCSRQAASLPA